MEDGLGDYIFRQEVLDNGFVELIDIMPREVPDGAESRDAAITSAARVSYLSESKGNEQDKKLLFYLFKHKHTSPFEQVIFKFRIKAPILVWWQLDRHRTIKYGRQNRQSGRYTEYDEEYYHPTVWRKQDYDNKQGSTEETVEYIYFDDDPYPPIRYSIDTCFKYYADAGFDYYHRLLEEGVAKEQARLFLPAFALYHTTVLNVDAWNLIHFLRLRINEHAQWEIRQYATAMERMFAEMLPWTYEAYKEKSENN